MTHKFKRQLKNKKRVRVCDNRDVTFDEKGGKSDSSYFWSKVTCKKCRGAQ